MPKRKKKVVNPIKTLLKLWDKPYNPNSPLLHRYYRCYCSTDGTEAVLLWPMGLPGTPKNPDPDITFGGSARRDIAVRFFIEKKLNVLVAQVHGVRGINQEDRATLGEVMECWSELLQDSDDPDVGITVTESGELTIFAVMCPPFDEEDIRNTVSNLYHETRFVLDFLDHLKEDPYLKHDSQAALKWLDSYFVSLRKEAS